MISCNLSLVKYTFTILMFDCWLFEKGVLAIQEIIEKITDFCYSFGEKYPNSHEFFQSSLYDLLQKEGCKIGIEYEIIFDCVKANGDIVRRRGFIDIFATIEEKKIAIEFDNGNNLKFKKYFQASTV